MIFDKINVYQFPSTYFDYYLRNNTYFWIRLDNLGVSLIPYGSFETYYNLLTETFT